MTPPRISVPPVNEWPDDMKASVPAPSFTNFSLPSSDTPSLMQVTSLAATRTRSSPPLEAVSVMSAPVPGNAANPRSVRLWPFKLMVTPSGMMAVPSPVQSQSAVSRTVPERRIEAHVGIAPATSWIDVSPVTSITRAASPADSFATR